MQIVIDIPDEIYKKYMDERVRVTDVLHAVRHGTPLPKGHGRLIDADILKNNIHYVPIAPLFQDDYVIYRNVIFADILDMLPTIIEGSEDNACLDEGNTR